MRRILAGIAVAALLSACACGAAAQTGMSVVDTSYVLPDGERVLELSIVVPAPLDEAWTAFTTSDGFRSCRDGVAIVCSIQGHDRLSGTDKLPSINQAFRDLSGNPEAKIALDAR